MPVSYTQNMVKFALVASLFALAACAVADVTSDVRCREIAFSRSAENRNIEAFKLFLDIDARFVGSSVLRGPDEISEAWKVFFTEGGPAIKWRPQFVEVLEDGTLALTRGPYRMIDKDADGNPVEVWGTFNSVWRKNADKEWRVVFDAGNSAAKPPDAETQALLDSEDTC
jgi:ketosteroid isomerase-like protein